MTSQVETNNLEERLESLLQQLTLNEKIALLSGLDNWHTVPIPRLGIPSITMTDGPHGVRGNTPEVGRKASPTTAFPTGVSMAATWNTDLVERAAAAMGEETHGMDCDVLLGPCVNIVRHPLAGRNFEAYSEDPYLAGRMGTAWVKGLQSQGVGASLKHFACNNQEIERGRGNSVVDERTLREIYLSQFEMITKEAHPWTVMCSYNRINGTYASQNHYLLKDILKNEWGFDGVVVSDWGANHTITESIAGGLDLEMPGPAKYYGTLLLEAVHNWQIDKDDVEEAARRVLRLILRSGRMDQGKPPAGVINTPGHQRLSEEVAEESITLLKNAGDLLPLQPGKIKSMAVIGPNAGQISISGGGSSQVEPPSRVNLLDALRQRYGNQISIRYAQGCDNFIEPPILRSGITPDGGKTIGFKAEYFDNEAMKGKPVDVHTDSKIDFWWGMIGPCGLQKYAVRWTTRLVVPETGRYTISITHSAAARLYLDGKLIAENKQAIGATPEPPEHTSPVLLNMTAGKGYELRVEYAKFSDESNGHIRLKLAFTPPAGEDRRIAQAVEAAHLSDVAIVFVGMPEGYESEGNDRSDMRLPGQQVELIQAVSQANPHTIVVLNCGSPVEITWHDAVSAILLAYYPGMNGGNAIARVLFGDVNPSGRLPVTFPRRLEDCPAFINFPGTKNVVYGEGIFVGYRYYDHRHVEPLFPFGFGLSYTSFEYSNFEVPDIVHSGESIQVTVKVKNSGQRAGKEVVELYVRDSVSSVARPPKELKGFKKVSLQPGEIKQVSFTLDPRAFQFYDPDRRTWVTESGEFRIMLGSSSRHIRSSAVIQMVE